MSEKNPTIQNMIRGCMIGGAIGDALGYAVEFLDEDFIFNHYGEAGITEYSIETITGKAVISDDTQMSLFTAAGLLNAFAMKKQGVDVSVGKSVERAYQDWYYTQNHDYDEEKFSDGEEQFHTKLMKLPELYQRRAPGNTCLSALHIRLSGSDNVVSFIKSPLNNSKGCGGIMRVAPYAIYAKEQCGTDEILWEGAEIAAITHSHSLGYMPAAVLVYILNQILYGDQSRTLKQIVNESKDALACTFTEDSHLPELIRIIDLAIELSEIPDADDLDNIHRIGEGWVAEETLGIALYCSLKYQNDFEKGIIAAVNHKGDSDSTGAVTGNILGALLGYDAIDLKWKEHLELKDEILEISDELYRIS